MEDFIGKEINRGDFLAYCNKKDDQLNIYRVEGFAGDKILCTRLRRTFSNPAFVLADSKISARRKVAVVEPPQYIRDAFENEKYRQEWQDELGRFL